MSSWSVVNSLGNMGLRRKAKVEVESKEDDTAEPFILGPLSEQNERVKLLAIETSVRAQLLDLLSPVWTSQCEKMLHFIYKNCAARGWFEQWNHTSTIISIRKGLDQDLFPHDLRDAIEFQKMARYLNSEVSFLMTTSLVEEFVRQLSPGKSEVVFNTNLRIQVRKDLRDLRFSKRNQHAAILRSSRQLLIWESDYQRIIPFALQIEDSIAKSLWSKTKKSEGLRYSRDEGQIDVMEPDTLMDVNRPIELLLPFMVFCAILLNFLTLGLATRSIIYESVRSRNWYRLLLFFYFPLAFVLTSFFCLILVVTIFNFAGPVSQLFRNSKFYSCIPPKRIKKDFPHITIQCPVYKEDLQDVIVPTVQSLKVAISTYERQGGTANIFINDDGLQLLSPSERETRKAYYALNEIGWVARPGHGKNNFGEFLILKNGDDES